MKSPIISTVLLLKHHQFGLNPVCLLRLHHNLGIHLAWVHESQVRDPADDMVLEAAVNAMADVIVSFNVKDYAYAPQRFGIDVLLPRDALTRFRASQQ